jgi:hypothetical protein
MYGQRQRKRELVRAECKALENKGYKNDGILYETGDIMFSKSDGNGGHEIRSVRFLTFSDSNY